MLAWHGPDCQLGVLPNELTVAVCKQTIFLGFQEQR